jgi:hypothetical protein
MAKQSVESQLKFDGPSRQEVTCPVCGNQMAVDLGTTWRHAATEFRKFCTHGNVLLDRRNYSHWKDCYVQWNGAVYRPYRDV